MQPKDRDLEPEAAEVIDLLEAFLDELDILQAKEPQMERLLNMWRAKIRMWLAEDKTLYALRKDINLESWDQELRGTSINVRPPKQFEFMEYRTVTRSLEERQKERAKRAKEFGYKGKDIMKVPLKETVHEDWSLVKVDRPKSESVERAAQLFQDIKARIKELWKKWQKEHPQRPLNHELIHRLAGTFFTIQDAARLGYQIQVERGLVPWSVSAKRGKKIDPQNVPKMLEPCLNMVGAWSRRELPAGLVFPAGKDHYIPKDYQLVTRKKHTPEELRQLKEELRRMLTRLYELQQEHKKDGSHTDPGRPCTNPDHKELHELHARISELWNELADATKNSILKKLGFWIYWHPQAGFLQKETET